MSPRCLTTGAIRQLPRDPEPDYALHGPVTSIVFRSGVLTGICDGRYVRIERAEKHWTMRAGTLWMARGSLCAILRIKRTDVWTAPDRSQWRVLDVFDHCDGDAIDLERAEPLFGVAHYAYGDVIEFFANGWTREASR